MDVAPDGRAFYSGPDQTLRALDTTGTGAWQTLGQRDTINRDYGGHAIYDVGKMLVAGGGPSTKDARVVDFNGATPLVSATAPMAFGRRQHNLTVLADGSVLATGGNSSGAGLVDLNAGVYPAEQWNPVTGQWRTLAAMQITRQYHSTALLLPDGRVLSSGGGICGTCDQVGYLGKNAEVFSPPYLFQADGTLAPRPVIDAAPASAGYGAPIEIATGNPAAIRKVALVRLGAVTHSDNMEQRYIPLSFTSGRDEPHRHRAGQRQHRAAGAVHALPRRRQRRAFGRPHGQRSERRLAADRHADAAGQRRDLHGPGHGEPGRDGVRRRHGRESRVLQRRGKARGGHDRAVQLHLGRGGAGTYTITARATDDLGTSTTSAASTITVSAANTAPIVSITVTGERRDLRLEADDHDHGDSERSRRQRDEGRVPQRYDACSARTRARPTPSRGGTSRRGATP